MLFRSPVFRFLQEQGNVADEEMFNVFNMGIGYVVAVRPTFAEAVMARLKKMGQEVCVLGKLTKGTGKVVIS